MKIAKRSKLMRIAAFLLLCLATTGYAAKELLALLKRAMLTQMNLNKALIDAARKGDTATVKALLAAGADVNARDYCGATALMLAEWNGHAEIANILRNAAAR